MRPKANQVGASANTPKVTSRSGILQARGHKNPGMIPGIDGIKPGADGEVIRARQDRFR